MKTIISLGNKEGYPKLLHKLQDIQNNQPKCSRKKYLRFPEVFQKIGGGFSMRKEEIWGKLFLLQDFGLIEIIPYHGIILKYKVVEDE